MVILLLLLLPFHALTAAMITTEIDPSSTTKLGYLEGKISVYRSSNQQVDTKSFQIAGKPLAVEFLFDAKLSPEERIRLRQYKDIEVVSVYRFYIASQPKGLYILPAISAMVAGQRVQSAPTTYTVTTQIAVPALTLELLIDPNEPLYPGQRAHLGYRITFNEPTVLTKEELPLIKTTGFAKIGQENITTQESESYSTQTISQEIRAISPGTFSFPESRIEGYTFREDLKGQRVYEKHLMASAPPAEVLVKAFPVENQPLSFTGALGRFIMDVHLLTSPNLPIGDEMSVLIRLTGKGEFDTVRLPDLACQPGFSGFFQMSDFPPKEHTDAFSKEFTVVLRPLSTQIQALPSIEFAFFDPYDEKYVTLKSREIPIKVLDSKNREPANKAQSENKPFKLKIDNWHRWLTQAHTNDLILPSLPQLKGLERANESYREGESAKNSFQQEKAFNQALDLYLQSEKANNSAALYDMIGNSFYQLGRYGWAIFYYQRALTLEPRNALIRQHMALAEDKLGLPHQAPTRWLSLREMVQLSLTALLAFLIALVTALWRPAKVTGVITVLLFSYVLYLAYGAPLKAVVVRSSILHSTHGEAPLLEGQRVDVLRVSDDGQTLFIKTADGKTGSLAYASVRM